jgi:dihydroxy-acid dehydratase
MGELDRGGLLDTSVRRVDGLTLKDALDQHDIVRDTATDEAIARSKAAPGAKGRNLIMGSQSTNYDELDTDRESGCIRDIKHAYSADGGLAILFGNIAEAGCIVKTAGVDPSVHQFSGTARIFESQDEACEGILDGTVQKGEVIIIRYEGPKGGPGMQEMLYPTSYLRSMKLDKACALVTDGRFSGGTSGLCIGHVSPEAASGGPIGLIEAGDTIDIDIPSRTINVKLSAEELEARRKKQAARGNAAFTPASRKREVSRALKAYALLAASADQGAIRVLPEDA